MFTDLSNSFLLSDTFTWIVDGRVLNWKLFSTSHLRDHINWEKKLWVTEISVTNPTHKEGKLSKWPKICGIKKFIFQSYKKVPPPQKKNPSAGSNPTLFFIWRDYKEQNYKPCYGKLVSPPPPPPCCRNGTISFFLTLWKSVPNNKINKE